MRISRGLVKEISLGAGGRAAWIECPPNAVPAPGQYLAAWAVGEEDQPLAQTLFPAISTGLSSGFRAAPALPLTWEPGMELVLRGPYGRGFHLPAHSLRLGLIALGETCERLLALLPQVLEQGSSIAVCADCSIPRLPPEVEIYPLESLPEVLPWADFLAIDAPRDLLATLPGRLGQKRALNGQVLVHTLMPCTGQAGCGACAIQGRRRPRLVCEDGPVFPLAELEW
jgi:dihydroorotate dehydrogenase electron transfer subunit